MYSNSWKDLHLTHTGSNLNLAILILVLDPLWELFNLLSTTEQKSQRSAIQYSVVADEDSFAREVDVLEIRLKTIVMSWETLLSSTTPAISSFFKSSLT